MGDMSEYRGLIFIGTFITLLVAMIALVPSDFAIASEDTRSVEFDSGFDSRNLIAWNSTLELDQSADFTYYYGNYFCDYGKPEFGHNLRMYIYPSAEYIRNEHASEFLGAYWGKIDDMEFVNKENVNRGTQLAYYELEEDYDTNLSASQYKVKCEHFYFEAYFTYNNTLYEDFAEAIDNTALYVVCGIDWDQMGTTHDAWSIISGVLLFDLPESLGGNIWVYALVSVPIWLAGIYLAFIFILRSLGAIFGGGGA